MNQNLSEKKCIACEGTESPLTPEQVSDYLSQVSGWRPPHEQQIEKEFIFTNFTQALDFVNQVGQLAESEGHHPDINLHSYKKVTITLSTHAIGGLSENDFILAAKIDQLI